LQTGNLSGAQADFAALQENSLQSSAMQSNNPIAQAFQQLSTDLQSGNLSAAQQDDSNIRQDFQNQASQVERPIITITCIPAGLTTAPTQVRSHR